jgi:hypothetical protein
VCSQSRIGLMSVSRMSLMSVSRIGLISVPVICAPKGRAISRCSCIWPTKKYMVSGFSAVSVSYQCGARSVFPQCYICLISVTLRGRLLNLAYQAVHGQWFQCRIGLLSVSVTRAVCLSCPPSGPYR